MRRTGLRAMQLGVVLAALFAGVRCCRAEGDGCSVVLQRSMIQLRPALGGDWKDAELAGRLERGYQLHYFEHRSVEAKAVLMGAWNAAERKGNRCAEGLAALGLGDYSFQNDSEAAKGWFTKAEAAFRELHTGLALGRVEFGEYLVATYGQDRAEATRLLTLAVEDLEKNGDARWGVRARLNLALQQYGEKVPDSVYEDLLAKAKGLKQPESIEGVMLRAFANRRQRQQRFDEASRYAAEADARFAACDCDLGEWGVTKHTRAVIENKQGQKEIGARYEREALRLFARAGDRMDVPNSLLALSSYYNGRNDMPRAENYMREALAAAQRIHSAYYTDSITQDLGGLYMDEGKPGLALPLLKQALLTAKSERRRCFAYKILGLDYHQLGREREADETMATAESVCRTLGDQSELGQTLIDRSAIKLKLGEPAAALPFAREAQGILENTLAHMEPNDANKQSYSAKVAEVYDLLIEILMKEKRYDEALSASEQARSRAFLDLLYSSRTMKADVLGAGAAGPEGWVLRSEAHVGAIRPEEITATLERLHSTLIGYWITDDTLYTWVARPGRPTFGVAQPMKRAALEGLVRRSQPAPGNADERTAWRQLYDVLVRPVEEYLPQEAGSRLTIVPSGPLFRVAFPALMDRGGHYLVERYAMHSSPAIGLLSFTAENEKTAQAMAPHYVFVADPMRFPVLADGGRLPALPGTAVEVRAVSRLLPVEQVTLLKGEDAGLRELTASLPTATTLHLATHAVMNDSDPFASFLALNRSLGPESDSGRLTVTQVYGLHLHTRLVVLSACRTGLGKISGDGVAGLSRAFFYAGTASVLATLWDVADEPTARLLPRFYEGLNAGASRSEALREAQLGLISDLRKGKVSVQTLGGKRKLEESPVLWAAFTLSGEP